MRWVVLAVAALAGCKGDCEEESCGDFCALIGAAPDPDQVFASCVQNAGASGGDFVLRDGDGNEVYSCEIEYDELGQEVGSCSYDFAGAKMEYCGCTYGYSTY